METLSKTDRKRSTLERASLIVCLCLCVDWMEDPSDNRDDEREDKLQGYN